MFKLFYIIAFLFCSHVAMSQDSTVLDYWENDKPKLVEYYKKEGQKKILLSENLYYTNGALWERITYNASDKTSLLIRYDINGKEKERMPFNEKGSLHGLYTQTYSNGNKVKEGTYINGKAEGLICFWYESGKKERETFYRNDSIISEKEWWENGNKRKEEDSVGTITFYHENGKIQSLLVNTKQGQSYIYWNETGLKREEQKVVNGNYYLMNYWNDKGKQTIKNGNGYWEGLDGEIGILIRVYYRKGKRRLMGLSDGLD